MFEVTVLDPNHEHYNYCTLKFISGNILNNIFLKMQF